MKKPMPKELIVRSFGGQVVRIVAMSDDAKEWIQAEAPQFGNLLDDQVGGFNLFVSIAFDINEVIEYLNSYNDGEKTQ